MENLIRQIRLASGLSQEQFARMLDRSTAMLRNYEKGAPPTDEVIEKLKEIASKCGRSDLRSALSGPEADRIKEVGHPQLQREIPAGRPARAEKDWHGMLEEVLGSDQPDAVEAVQANLIVFVDRVRLRRKKSQPAKSKRKIP